MPAKRGTRPRRKRLPGEKPKITKTALDWPEAKKISPKTWLIKELRFLQDSLQKCDKPYFLKLIEAGLYDSKAITHAAYPRVLYELRARRALLYFYEVRESKKGFPETEQETVLARIEPRLREN